MNDRRTIDWVDRTLHAWAIWLTSVERKAIGYPSSSPMFRDMPSNDVFESKVPLGMNATDYSNVSVAVNALPYIPRQIVVAYYRQANGSRRKTAVLCGISEKSVTQYLGDAHTSLAAELEAYA